MVFGWFKKLKKWTFKIFRKDYHKNKKKLLKEKKLMMKLFQNLEEILISSDMGVKFSLEVIEDLKNQK